MKATRRDQNNQTSGKTDSTPPSDEDQPNSLRPERMYAGLTADERRADRRRRLLDAGLELFGTEGYAYTGIERICSHAGVTARHFYDEFASRENLLIAVYDEVVAAAIHAVAIGVASVPPDPIATTRAGVDAFLHAMLDDPRHARVQCIEVIGVSAALESHRRRVLHKFAEVVAEQADALGMGRARATDRQRHYASLALVGGPTNCSSST